MPAVIPPLEDIALSALLEHIGARPQGRPAGLPDDRNIQQGRQIPVGAGQAHRHTPLSGLGGGNPRQAVAVQNAVFGLGQGSGHIGRRHGCAVGEGDAAAQGEGPGEAVGRHRVSRRQGGLGHKGLIQLIKPVIEQPSQGQIGPVAPLDGVKPGLRIAGERKFLGLCRGRRRGGLGGRGGWGGLPLPAGAQDRAQKQDRCQKPQALFPLSHRSHYPSSWSMAAWLPRTPWV